MESIEINRLYRMPEVALVVLKVENLSRAAMLDIYFNNELLPKPYGGAILDPSGIVALISKCKLMQSNQATIKVLDDQNNLYLTWVQDGISDLSASDLDALPASFKTQLADTLLKRMLKHWGNWTDDEAKVLHSFFENKKPIHKDKNHSVEINNQEISFKFNVELVLRLQFGMLVIGWIFDPYHEVVRLMLVTDDKDTVPINLLSGDNGSLIKRTLRPDVTNAILPSYKHNSHGFVAYAPISSIEKLYDLYAIKQDGLGLKVALEPLSLQDEFIPNIEAIWQHSGHSILQIVENLKKQPKEVVDFFCDVDALFNRKQAGFGLMACDRAWVLNEQVLLIEGWISLDSDEIKSLKLNVGNKSINVLKELIRNNRPDLHKVFAWAINRPVGFAISLNVEFDASQSMRLKIETNNGMYEVLNFRPEPADWTMLQKFVLADPNNSFQIIESLIGLYTRMNDQHSSGKLVSLKQQLFISTHRELSTFVENANASIASIDIAIPTGDGILLFGWHYEPLNNLNSIQLHGPTGCSDDIRHKLFKISRLDVSDQLKVRYQNVDEFSGFVVYVPFKTNNGDARALCFDCGNSVKSWIKVPTEFNGKKGMQQIKYILERVTAPNKIQHKLYQLFDEHLGRAIEDISKENNFEPTGISQSLYGSVIDEPEISIIIPLFGRYDFMRHQLAHFSQDPDFKKVDLIYVIDDPSIANDALMQAAISFSAFNIPFRVISYSHNLGYGGANNVGVKFARSECIVLLNSDVIPTRSKWLGILKSQLLRSNDIGAVGPLLLFPDGAIQHGGMFAYVDERYPGFILNGHTNKGQRWIGGDSPINCEMLTAACLMLRRKDFESLGGFDLGYLIGDFEDSDICLALKKMHKSLVLVPEAKLWHLERQSQNIGIVGGYRQLITLYNAWRFKKKIKTKQIAAPTLKAINQCEF